MGNIGFRSGKLIASQIKSGDKYIVNRQTINYENLNSTFISGSAAFATSIGGAEVVQAVPVYEFGSVDSGNSIALQIVAPLSLKSKTKCNLGLYWTSNLSGSFGCEATSGCMAGDVVWDAVYWSTSLLTSGTTVGGFDYVISGISLPKGNTTATGPYNQLASLVSGVLQKTDLEIPAGEIYAGDIINVNIFRDGTEDLDTLDSTVGLISVLVEYVEG